MPVDKAMIEADGTKDKSKLGANAILAVSIACSKSSSYFSGYSAVSFPWRCIRQPSSGSDDEHCKWRLPCTVFRIGCTGVHDYAGRRSVFQRSALSWCAEVFHALAAILKERGLATSVGDEGGFAPASGSLMKKQSRHILEAVKKAGYEPGKDFKIAMDAASSEWKSEERQRLL